MIEETEIIFRDFYWDITVNGVSVDIPLLRAVLEIEDDKSNFKLTIGKDSDCRLVLDTSRNKLCLKSGDFHADLATDHSVNKSLWENFNDLLERDVVTNRNLINYELKIK